MCMYKRENDVLNTPLNSSPLRNRHAQEAECDAYRIPLDCPALIIERALIFSPREYGSGGLGAWNGI